MSRESATLDTGRIGGRAELEVLPGRKQDGDCAAKKARTVGQNEREILPDEWSEEVSDIDGTYRQMKGDRAVQ